MLDVQTYTVQTVQLHSCYAESSGITVASVLCFNSIACITACLGVPWSIATGDW